jgi:maltose O-acetyltransferase
MMFNLRTFVFFYLWNYGVSWLPTGIGRKLRALILRLFLKKAGKNIHTSTGVFMNWSQNIEVGDNVDIGQHVHLGGRGNISIGDDSMIGLGTVIGTGTYLYSDAKTLIRQQKRVRSPVVIGKDVLIGINCIIHSGNRKLTIGDGAVIGSGSRVVRDVKPYTILAGNPAVVIGRRR